MRAVGDSMRPTYAPGAQIEVWPVRAEELAIGDVVAFVGPDGAVVAHRLVARRGDRFVTRGDNVPCEDGPWRAEQLVGRVANAGRLGRAIARWPVAAPLLAAAARIHSLRDLPGALVALAAALAVRALRAWGFGGSAPPSPVSSAAGVQGGALPGSGVSPETRARPAG